MKKRLLLIGITFLSFQTVFCQDFMLQGWYWDYPKDGCNSYSGVNWANTLLTQASQIKSAGFTYVWLPPLSRASFGACSNGYDPKDLYDLGEYGLGRTGFGTRAEYNAVVAALNSSPNPVNVVADVVYNHRDGGSAEDNSAVKAYIETHMATGKSPFPSDRFRCYVPIGGSSPYGAGHYYFKVKSKTGNYGFSNKYKIYVNTAGNPNTTFLGSIYEVEPNGGGDCGQVSNDILLHQDRRASLGDTLGCSTDEFHLDLSASQFTSGGDRLTIYLTNTDGGYSDHYIYGIWYDSDGNGPTPGTNVNLANYLKYETYTNFNGLPSGQGGMNFENFKPNTSNAATTYLGGDWDWLWFFYDYDQNSASTQSVLYDWTNWLWSNAGIRGYRMDAVKHFPPFFVGDLLDNLHANGRDPGMVVGEIFDSSPSTLKAWINDVKASMDDAPGTEQYIQPRVFDFALRAALKAACDDFGNNVRNVFSSGMVNTSPAASGSNVVTFVNNHDFRENPATSDNEAVQNDPMLAYAYILTDNRVGLPCVFYADYFGSTLPYYPTVNLGTQISELISIHKNYIFNSANTEYLNHLTQTYADPLDPPYWPLGIDRLNTTLFYQLSGTPANDKDVIVAINFAGEALDMWHYVDSDSDNNGSTNFPVGTTFNRVTTNNTAPNLVIPSDYRVHIQVPARSYAIWVEGALLPVSLLDFQAIPKEKHVELIWQTESESNFANYEVERSLDGKNFEKIATLIAEGKNGGGAEYRHEDHSPVFNQLMYYRLKMNDLDGTSHFSQVKSAELKNGWEAFTLLPNPAKNEGIFTFKAPEDGEGKFLVFDLTGKRVLTAEIDFQEGLNQIPLNFSAVPGGFCMVQFVVEGQVWWTEKMVIQR